MAETRANLAQIFQAVADTLLLHRETLNQADTINGNHGEHMLEIFRTATQAIAEKPGMDLAEEMDAASQLLTRLSANGSAQVYSRGLAQFALQFREHQVTLEELLAYVQGVAREKTDETPQAASPRSGEVLKALVGGLSGWQQSGSSVNQGERKLDMGGLFEMGMAYLQAKQRGGNRLEVLADAAASASPLSQVPYRYQSGKLALQALLQAMV